MRGAPVLRPGVECGLAQVCSLIWCCRQSSPIGTPFSPCPRMYTICSGVNLLVHIGPTPSLVGDRIEALYASRRGLGKRAKTNLVRFLFFSAWRVGEVRTLEWRDYDWHEGVIRLRPERSNNRYGRIVPVDRGACGNHCPPLERPAPHCPPYVFHANSRPVSDFRKRWTKACNEVGLTGRIVHDLRRSGVRHMIHGGVPPHTVVAFSSHRTASMLKRYDIIDVDDLRQAAERASSYLGEPAAVVLLRAAEWENADRTPTGGRRG